MLSYFNFGCQLSYVVLRISLAKAVEKKQKLLFKTLGHLSLCLQITLFDMSDLSVSSGLAHTSKGFISKE